MRYTILAFIDAMIYCSNELLRLENIEKNPKEEIKSSIAEEEENISFEFSALEIIRKMYRKILELATICNQLKFFLDQINLRKNLGKLDQGQLIETVMNEPILDEELHDDNDESFNTEIVSYIKNPVDLQRFEHSVRLVY